MLSFKENKGLLIAEFKAYHKKHNKFVFYDKEDENDSDVDDEEQMRELIRLQYGKERTRYLKNFDELELDKRYSMLKKPALEGEFIPFFPQNEHGERNIMYIFGKSGSGKSTLAKKLSHEFSKVMHVFIISPVVDKEYKGTFLKIGDLVEVDKTNDVVQQKQLYEEAKIKFKYKKKELVSDPEGLCALELALNEMKPDLKRKRAVYQVSDYYKQITKKPTLFIYDDTEAEGDKEKLEYLQNLQLLTGRHDGISMMILNHQANNGMKTRHTINESNMFTFFQPFNKYTAYFLKNYLQLDTFVMKKVQELLKNSRYVCIYKNENILLAQNKMITF